jgi:hypothetical protein
MGPGLSVYNNNQTWNVFETLFSMICKFGLLIFHLMIFVFDKFRLLIKHEYSLISIIKKIVGFKL